VGTATTKDRLCRRQTNERPPVYAANKRKPAWICGTTERAFTRRELEHSSSSINADRSIEVLRRPIHSIDRSAASRAQAARKTQHLETWTAALDEETKNEGTTLEAEVSHGLAQRAVTHEAKANEQIDRRIDPEH